MKNPADCEVRAVIRFLTAQNAWDFFPPHPPNSQDLAPSDFHFFTHLKKFLGGMRMRSSDEVG
jgi:hypothetical protein